MIFRAIICACAAFATNAIAQDYPNRAIRLLTAEAGGGLDF